MWPMRGLDDEVRPEVAGDRLRLRRRLDDDETLRHRRVTIAIAAAGDTAPVASRPAHLPASPRSSADPCSTGLFRLRARGLEHVPARAASCSRATTCRTSTRGRSGCRSGRRAGSASWRSRSSTGGRCACVLDAAGAFPVRRGVGRHRGDRDSRPARARGRGRRDVPRGHAAEEGAAEEAPGRAPRIGAARIALEPACRSSRPRLRGTDRLLAARDRCAVAYGEPIELDDLRGATTCDARPGRDRTADGADRRARGVAVSVLLAVDGDSFAHRAYHALPKSIRRQRASSASRTCSRGSGRRSSRAPSSSAGTRSTSRPTGTRRFAAYQSGREFERVAPRAARRCCPSSCASFGFLGREGARLRGRRLPRRAARRGGRGDGARGDVGPRRVPARERPGHDPPADPRRERDRAHRARRRCASATASSRSRCRTSSRCAATRRTSCPARRGVGPKTAADLLAQYGSLEAVLADGRFAARGGRPAPLPANRDDGRRRAASAETPGGDARPDWDGGAELAACARAARTRAGSPSGSRRGR